MCGLISGKISKDLDSELPKGQEVENEGPWKCAACFMAIFPRTFILKFPKPGKSKMRVLGNVRLNHWRLLQGPSF